MTSSTKQVENVWNERNYIQMKENLLVTPWKLNKFVGAGIIDISKIFIRNDNLYYKEHHFMLKTKSKNNYHYIFENKDHKIYILIKEYEKIVKDI